MKCPFCSHLESKVTDSRVATAGDVIRRRRECESCARRFTTYERVEEVLPLVVKKDGRREMFDRQKLLAGLRRACEKRAIALDRIEAIVDAIERELIDSGDKEVSANLVGAFSHVGIYVGDGKFIHSPKPGAQVRVESMGISYWASRFDGARRVASGGSNVEARQAALQLAPAALPVAAAAPAPAMQSQAPFPFQGSEFSP